MKITQHRRDVIVFSCTSDESTFDYSLMLLFDVCFSNNFIFLFHRYYYFNVYFFNVCYIYTGCKYWPR